MALKPPTPLSIINQQCAQHQGELLKAIRIHVDDYHRLRKELIECGFEVYQQFTTSYLYGRVPIIFDKDCVEGPVCVWTKDDFDETIEKWKRFMLSD